MRVALMHSARALRARPTILAMLFGLSACSSADRAPIMADPDPGAEMNTGGVAPSVGSGGSAAVGNPAKGTGSMSASMDAKDAAAAADSAVDSGDNAPRPEPNPVDACGMDLEATVGEARPDFGATPMPVAFKGDPNEMGTYAVKSIQETIPNPDSTRPALVATFYVPSSDGGSTIADGTFAFVLVMHGFGTTHVFYEHFTKHMASHGLVVLGITLPGALVAVHDKNANEAIAAIDFALADPKAAEVSAHIDPTKVAVAGHSFGGKIAFYAAAQDPRIKLVVGWDPSNAGGPPCFVDPQACNSFPVAPNCLAMDSGIMHKLRAETLIFRAAPDGANPEPAHNAIHFFRGAPEPATLIDYDTSVLHGDFANATAAVVPRARRIQLAFLLNRFYGTTGLDAWLPNGKDIGAGAVRVLYKP